jgi:ribonuclease D
VLHGRALAALRSLAAWRQTRALAENKPLSWVLPEPAMVELCKRGARSPRDLRAVRGIGEGTIRQYGDEIVAALSMGADQPAPPAEPPPPPPSARAQIWAAVVGALVQARCVGAGIAPRFVANRADADALAAWFDGDARAVEPDIPLLQGWRRELAGEAALAWLRGEVCLRSDPAHAELLVLVAPDAPPRW